MAELATILLAAGAAVAAVTMYRALRVPVLRPGTRVALVGDSLAVGVADALAAELAARDCTLRALGEGATTTLQWLPKNHLGTGRLLPALDDCDVVLTILGTNDCHYAYGYCDPYPERLGEIADEIASRGAHPVIIAMPMMPWEDTAAGARRMYSARQAMSDVAADVGGTYIDEPESSISRWPDQIHPDVAGNRRWAAYIAEQLDRARRWR